LDLGLIDLATQRYHAGAQAFQAGVTHMLYTCSVPRRLVTCDKPQPVTSHGLQQDWLAGAMGSLETLANTAEAAHSPALRSAITRAEAVLTASVATGKVESGPVGSPLKVPRMVGFLDPNNLELNVAVPAGIQWFKMAAMPLTVLWYQRPVGATDWSAISETACWGHGQQDCGSYDAAGNFFKFITLLLASDNQCFTNVQYRAELYVGGRLAGALTLGPKSDFIATNLTPALAKSMNVGVCVPSTWHLQPTMSLTLSVTGTNETLRGPLSTAEMSYASPDHKEGVYVFRLYPPRTVASGAVANMQSLVEATGNAAIGLVGGRGLPSDMKPEDQWAPTAIWGPDVQDMMVNGYGSPSTGTAAFVGAAVVAPGGVLPTAAEQDNAIAGEVPGDYAVVVTIVYGERGSGIFTGSHTLGLQVFSSWSLLNYG
jgi:hypothetical protein